MFNLKTIATFKINMKFPYPYYLLVFIVTFPIISCAEPSDNEIMLWLGGMKVHVGNGFFGKIHDNINISNIKDIKKIGKNTNTGPIKSTTTLKSSFVYSYKNNNVPCNASFTYEWITVTMPSRNHTLLTKIVECTPP